MSSEVCFSRIPLWNKQGKGIFSYQFNDPIHLDMTVTNTTVTGNQALFGGGVALGNSIVAFLSNMTIVGNTPSGVFNAATVTIQDSILAKIRR
jgi:hypothetical protein